MITAAKPEPEEFPEPVGGGGALFTREDNLRSDARLAARMISLGVVSVERAEQLLRDGFRLARISAKKQDARSWAACMKIPLELAKLEQAVLGKIASNGPVTNQQINIYLPSNERDAIQHTNGNGRH